ncbi:MAG TPA: PPC domain-containing protein, partial [Bacillota bacterium]|nr:PPC domain-containing protein [Bacillota bacterium]
ETQMMASPTTPGQTPASADEPTRKLAARIEKRIGECVNRPASVALANIVYVEVTLAPDAQLGQRELRLGTPRGLSNPLVFHVGQLPEVRRKPMITAPLQVLGKEELALRKRPADEAEDRVSIPCTLNGQIASGELNRYRFTARQGQRLVITTQARQLIPFIADAVPGWFQPVLALYDANGKEVAYDDDYRFKPDPTLFYQVPRDGEYVLVIYDAIYRGREDFVYRISIGEIPFVTSIFPLGGCTNTPVALQMKGWNLEGAALTPLATDAEAGIYSVTATKAGFVSNPLPFARDTLPEGFDQEPNDTLAKAQKVSLPIIVNGHMDRPGDWDIFRFSGKSNDTVVAEVSARRLDSPLDSLLKLTDASGKLLALNDDREDPVAGVNTHHADSYLMARLPADGTYYVHLGDTARNAGAEYGYRLRLSAPRPDFELRVVPSSVSLRGKSSATVNVQVIRKDGFAGAIKVSLKDPPAGFSASPVSLVGTQAVARLTLKTTLAATPEPVNLSVIGTAKIQDRDVTHTAVPA